ncbi:phosphatidate cytidylyltransferase [Chitinimonas sp. BJB300]|uniref:phosphatidate cytidylyltransferase n=1 Tax=Chitinimonas sp. BJB300 TaxID=1559339 RepID=UPI000C0FCF3D|nr:phosphatidate cytidylyltransferase [Chitinimonas sp. BJB300]PHV13126.1 phosphatidate cytidylyltransferase [Chitinimonas sp. BJB300]TSJ84723.1 phosphatidate cytidylyltransferase [Chitinimonas sp. BJB300]
MLKTRVLTVLVLLPLVLAALFVGPPLVWSGFALFALSFGAWEWTRFARFDRAEQAVFISAFIALGAAWLLLPLACSWALILDGFALLFWLLIVPFWLRQKWTLRHKWSSALLGWLILLSALAAVSRFRELNNGSVALLLVLAIAWVADIAAYFAGRAFGRRKLAPSISPGKSWEGVYGALIAVSIYLVVLQQVGAPLVSSLSLMVLLPLGWALTGVSVMGDLFESLLKRQTGLKDSSNLLPGHGGVLDRVDSLLALAPVAAALLFAYASHWLEFDCH